MPICSHVVCGRSPSSKSLTIYLKLIGVLQLLKVLMRTRFETSYSDESDAEVTSFGMSSRADSRCLSTFRRFLEPSFLKSHSPSFLALSTVYTVQSPEDQSLYEIVPSTDQHCFLPLLPLSIFLPQKVL